MESAPLWKKILFGLISAALLLGIAEAALRVAGVRPILYDEDPYVGFSSQVPLFVEDVDAQGKSWRVTARNKLTLFNAQRFADEKPANTYRIFCVGGSTTYGRPYDDAPSFAGWLREMLPAIDPSRNWEVINAGGISYASYRVALLMEELARYQPDLFIVYSGQNEFLERRTYSDVFEMPSAVRAVGSGLSRTSLYTVLASLMRGGTQPRIDRDVLPAEVETILEESIGPEAYGRDDAWQQQVIDHYRFNLSRMVDIAQSAAAGILFVVPASNLSHCSPFKSEGAGDAPDPQPDLEAVERRLASGQPRKALDILERVLRTHERHARAHYLRGQTLHQLGETAAALEAYQMALNEDVCPLRVLDRMQRIVSEVARVREVSFVDFAALVADASPDAIAGESLFLDHVHPTVEGHRILAAALLEKLIAQETVQPARAVDAVTAEAASRIEAGIDRADEAAALRNLAKVFAWAGKNQEASRLSERALELDPTDIEAMNTRGMQQLRSGDTAAAILSFEQALALEPDFTEARLHLANALVQSGQAEAGIEHLRAVLDGDPGHYKAHNNLGLALQAVGDLESAEVALRRALALRPKDVTALNNLGNVLGAGNRLVEAERTFALALEIEPEHAAAQYGLGLMRARQRRPAEARPPLERALQLRPDFPEAVYTLGLVMAQLGDRDQARAHLARALELRPDYAEAQAMLERLSDDEREK